MNMYTNVTESYDDIQTVVSFMTPQSISEDVKSWVLVNDVT